MGHYITNQRKYFDCNGKRGKEDCIKIKNWSKGEQCTSFLNLHYIVRKLLSDFTVVNCSDPGFVENSIRHGQQNFPESFKYGSSVIYHCKKGFYLLGSSTVTCKANGLWDRSLPKCLRKYQLILFFSSEGQKSHLSQGCM